MLSSTSVRTAALGLLAQEARGLMSRLERVKPFALNETMVPAAAPSLAAQTAIESYLTRGKATLRRMVLAYQDWLASPAAHRAPVDQAQRRLTFLRLRFNAILAQFDIFAEVMTQRSERDNGVLLAGLDVLASDVLALPGGYFSPPPVVCYLDRQHGAAIRRVTTRLPGGGRNPVAILRIPRERMVAGSGIGSSLAHEVGHQGAALLDLAGFLRQELRRMQPGGGEKGRCWQFYERWTGELLADCWSVSRVGVAATLGLMGVVSLPRAFVFRVSLDQQHPIPWLRVKLSAAIGNALYPDPQWPLLSAIWEAYYPLAGLDSGRRRILTSLEAMVPEFVDLLLSHRPPALRGESLGEAMRGSDRTPGRLRSGFRTWRSAPEEMRLTPPSVALAAISQARADGALSPEADAELLTGLLTHWALSSALYTSAVCVEQANADGFALAV